VVKNPKNVTPRCQDTAYRKKRDPKVPGYSIQDADARDQGVTFFGFAEASKTKSYSSWYCSASISKETPKNVVKSEKRDPKVPGYSIQKDADARDGVTFLNMHPSPKKLRKLW
jgi:hypothetical protein